MRDIDSFDLKIKSWTQSSFWLSLVWILCFAGCSFSSNPLKIESPQTQSSSSSSSCEGEDCKTPAVDSPSTEAEVETEPDIATEPEEPARKPVHTIMIAKQSQILTSMSKCLNLTPSQLSDETLSNYQKIRPNLPLFGKIEELSAPLMMSVLQIAGDVCTDLIVKERGERHFFRGFSLNGSAAQTDPDVTLTLSMLARACWGRSAAPSELEIVEQGFMESPLADSRNEKAALFLCTAVLASVEGVRY